MAFIWQDVKILTAGSIQTKKMVWSNTSSSSYYQIKYDIMLQKQIFVVGKVKTTTLFQII